MEIFKFGIRLKPRYYYLPTIYELYKGYNIPYMERENVLKIISAERDFQEVMKKEPSSHINNNFSMGDALTAIEVNLNRAKEKWYNGVQQYSEVNEYLRKVAAICVQMGEDYGMPMRETGPINNL